MESPGKFLLIDDETTRLLQILAKIQPYGNKTVLKIILKFYIRLAKYAKKIKTEPIYILEGILEREIAGELAGFELDKIKKIDRMIEKAGDLEPGIESTRIASEIAELKTMVRELAVSSTETLTPREKAKLLKVEKGKKPAERVDYRDIRKKLRPKKIEF